MMYSLVLLLIPCLLLNPAEGQECQEELKQLKDDVANMRAEFKIGLDEALEMKEESMMTQMEIKLLMKEVEMKAEFGRQNNESMKKIAALEEEIRNLKDIKKNDFGCEPSQVCARDLPYIMVTAYLSHWVAAWGNTLTYEFKTADQGSGELDVTTGIFTTLVAGHYTVSYSGEADCGPGQAVTTYLWRSGERIEASRWHSYSGTHGGTQGDMGG